MRSAAWAVAAWSVLTVTLLEGVDYASAGLAGLVLILALLTSLALLVVGAARRSRRLATAGGLLLVAVAASLATLRVVGDRQRAVSMARGDRIAAALEVYRERVGSYPASLELLVPRDLAAVPPSATGVLRTHPYAYEPRAADYVLRFPEVGWTGRERGRDGEWRWYD